MPRYQQPETCRKPRRTGNKKVVKVGDPSRRVTLTLPPTMHAFQQCVSKLFGAGMSFSLWLDPGAKGRTPGRGRVPVVSEADYSRILNEDVLVVAIDGQEISADDISRISTMQHDFRPMPHSKAQPVKRSVARGPTGAKLFGQSSHRRDFTAPPAGYLRQAPNCRKEDWISNGRRFEATTTYNDAFVAHPIQQSKQLLSEQPRERPPPFTHVTSYSIDYAGMHDAFIPSTLMVPRNKQLPESNMKSGEPMISSYQADYREHPCVAFKKPKSTAEVKEMTPFAGCSTYNRDFTAKGIDPLRRVYLEPTKGQTNAA